MHKLKTNTQTQTTQQNAHKNLSMFINHKLPANADKYIEKRQEIVFSAVFQIIGNCFLAGELHKREFSYFCCKCTV